MSQTEMREKFMQAYNQWADDIFRHCYFRVSDREKAKDLAQECFLKTWKYISEKGEVQNLRAFLYRVANNLVVDYARKKKPVSLDQMMEEEGFEPGMEDEEKIVAKADFNLIKKDLDKLDPIYREAVIMRYMDNLQPREIAEVIHLPENVVSVRIHRGIRQLRELLDNA